MADNTLQYNMIFNEEGLEDVTADLEGLGTTGAEAGAAAAEGFAEMGEAAATAGTEATGAATEAAEATEGATAAAIEGSVAQKELGESAETAGDEGSEAADKMGEHMDKMMTKLILITLVFKAFEDLAKQSDAFQQLQAGFEDFFQSVITNLQPMLDMIATGLNGILPMVAGVLGVIKPIISTLMADIKSQVDIIMGVIGAAIDVSQGNFKEAAGSIADGFKQAGGEWKGVAGQYVSAWNGAVDGISKGMDAINGKHKIMTAEMAKDLADELKAQEKHNSDMAAAQVQGDEQKLKNKDLSLKQQKALIDDEGAAEIAALKKNLALELQIVNANLASHQITQAQAASQRLALEQSTSSKELQITQQTNAKKVELDTAATDKLLANMQKVTNAGAKAFAEKLKETNSLGQATQAAAEAMIEQEADQAAESIEISGLTAAGKAFASAPNPYIGAAEAAGVLLWYSALAAAVGGAGAAIGGAVGGSSSSSSSSTSSSSSGTNSSSSSTSSSGSSSTPAGANIAAGTGTLNLSVFLDTVAILKLVSQASFNGNLQISANAITGL